MAARAGLLALLLAPSVWQADAGFAGFSADGPLAGNPEANVRFSTNRTSAWVNLTVSGYREPLWRIEPLVRSWAAGSCGRRPSSVARALRHTLVPR